MFHFEDYGSFGFERCPKGDFAQIAVNPYNGKIVMTFNDRAPYTECIEAILHQIARDLHLLRMSTGGRAGLLEFARACDEKRDFKDMGPSVVRMRRGEAVSLESRAGRAS